MLEADVVMNEDDKFELREEEEKLKREEEAVDLINSVGNRVYNIPRHEGELNLYKEILNSISVTEDVDKLRSLLEEIEPNLMNKNDIVQKIMISSILLNKIFILKHLKPDIDIFKLTKGIEYREDTGTWLKIMKEYTIPVLMNNDLIKDLKDV
jgi:hypothetical protein